MEDEETYRQEQWAHEYYTDEIFTELDAQRVMNAESKIIIMSKNNEAKARIQKALQLLESVERLEALDARLYYETEREMVDNALNVDALIKLSEGLGGK